VRILSIDLGQENIKNPKKIAKTILKNKARGSLLQMASVW